MIITRSEIIQSLIEGLKNATETGISNQVSEVQVLDKNGEMLVSANFSLDYPSHALSPEFIAGLEKAGVAVREWEERESALKDHEDWLRQSRLWGLSIGIGLLLILFINRRRAARNH